MRRSYPGKNKHSRRVQGFSFIELMIVIAIIGILMSIVLSSLNSARSKAKISSWKSSVSSSQPAVLTCCSDGKIITNAVGSPICNGGADWPGANSIGDITIQNNCDALTAAFKYSVNGPDNDVSGSCQPAICDQSGCTFSPVDSNHHC